MFDCEVILKAGTMKQTVLQVIPNLGAGGAEQSCVDIVAGLTERGYRALVVSAGGSRIAEVERLGGKHFIHSVNSKNPFVILKNAVWLAKFIRDKKVDVVHARSRAPAWSAWLASRMTGRHFVTTFHAAYKFSNSFKRFYNLVMARGDRIIAVSRFIAEYITCSYDVDPDKIRVIFRGIDLTKLKLEEVNEESRSALRDEWVVDEGQRIVLMPARLSPIKGHKVLIEAMALLSPEYGDVVAIIVGDDQGREAYRRELEARILSNRLADKVKLVGHCDDMPTAYSLAVVVVMPSRIPEGFGRVPVEAMAMGVPVIASDLGATNETVQEGKTGWLLPPSNPQSWANAIAEALAMKPEQRACMAEAARLRAQTYFDRRRMISDTIAVYDELMGKDV